MKVIFVCKHNRFRSKIAEAYFKKFNENKNIQVISGGIFKGIPVSKKVMNISREEGLKINSETSCLKEKGLVEADLIVIVANDVPIFLFKPRFKKVILWNIPDTGQNNEDIKKIINMIFKKVDELIKSLRGRK